MDWRNTWDSFQRWAAGNDQRQALAEFTCAHCDRSASCGRPPSDDCVEKLEQIERGQDWRYRTVASGLRPEQIRS